MSNIVKNKMPTISAILSEEAKENPGKLFIMEGKQTFSYKDIEEQSCRIANSLLQMNVKVGDKICGLLCNSFEHVCIWLAVGKIGAVFVPVNVLLDVNLISYTINDSDARILILDQGSIAKLGSIQEQIKNIEKVIVIDGREQLSTSRWEVWTYNQLLQGSPQPANIQVKGTDLSTILYTSGTTGLPKGVMLSHEYFVVGGELMIDKLKQGTEDIFYSTLPFYHIMGQISGVCCPICAGAQVVLAKRFSVSQYWSDVRKYGCTCSCLTGAQVNYLYQQPSGPEDAKHNLRIISAFPVTGNIAEGFESRFGVKLRNIYGLTEALLPLIGPAEGTNKAGSLGLPTDYEVRIADDTDHELPDYEVGNIVIRPKKTSRRIFDGYYKKPEATIEMIKHCWFHTGDMGFKDSDGFIWFAGRKKDVIRFRGENISPDQVENIINTHPKVAETCIIGVPSPASEEDVKALVRLKEGQRLKPEELIAFCEDKMTSFMIPRYVEFVDSLPKTATDKFEKFKLKANWKTPKTWDREEVGYKLKRTKY
jgi:crotonobetaine/carnitine-CoA ligase